MNVQNVLDQKTERTFREVTSAGPNGRSANAPDWSPSAAQPDLAAVISIKDLCVTYRARGTGQPDKQAVKELTLTVQPGEVFGFLGPNGAGKTTTMNVLLGFANATSNDT